MAVNHSKFRRQVQTPDSSDGRFSRQIQMTDSDDGFTRRRRITQLKKTSEDGFMREIQKKGAADWPKTADLSDKLRLQIVSKSSDDKV